jgi:hypothetical protein
MCRREWGLGERELRLKQLKVRVQEPSLEPQLDRLRKQPRVRAAGRT